MQNFWNELKIWLDGKQLTRLADKININEVILGGSDCLLMNHIVSVGIQMIYSKKQLSLPLALAFLLGDLHSERFCAKIRGKMEDFDRKWGAIRYLEDAE